MRVSRGSRNWDTISSRELPPCSVNESRMSLRGRRKRTGADADPPPASALATLIWENNRPSSASVRWCATGTVWVIWFQKADTRSQGRQQDLFGNNSSYWLFTKNCGIGRSWMMLEQVADDMSFDAIEE